MYLAVQRLADDRIVGAFNKAANLASLIASESSDNARSLLLPGPEARGGAPSIRAAAMSTTSSAELIGS
jgi:hypothetical protein